MDQKRSNDILSQLLKRNGIFSKEDRIKWLKLNHPDRNLRVDPDLLNYVIKAFKIFDD